MRIGLDVAKSVFPRSGESTRKVTYLDEACVVSHGSQGTIRVSNLLNTHPTCAHLREGYFEDCRVGQLKTNAPTGLALAQGCPCDGILPQLFRNAPQIGLLTPILRPRGWVADTQATPPFIRPVLPCCLVV